MYPFLLTLTFMTGPWGAQEGIGEGGRGSFLKLACPSIARLTLILDENKMRGLFSGKKTGSQCNQDYMHRRNVISEREQHTLENTN